MFILRLKYWFLPLLFLCLITFEASAQINPFVSSAAVVPSPMISGGNGILSFNTGNTGNEPIPLGENRVILRIELRNGVPDNDSPVDALGGTAVTFFTWTFNNSTYTGVQNTAIPANTTANITIEYRATQNSLENNPRNGFQARIDPGPYADLNDDSDDVDSAYTWTECQAPQPPEIGTITQPTCTSQNGSIIVSNLPEEGSWILTRLPVDIETRGSGSTVTLTDIPPGSYTFVVTNSEGCTSTESERAVVDEQPDVPSSPEHRVDCYLGNGLAIITVVSPVVRGYEYRIDDRPFQDSRTFLSIGNGTHTISVRSEGGCITTGDPFTVSCGCVNRPTITLSDRDGTVCGLSPVTVSDNSFGGSATSVTITENGAGSVSPGTVTDSPFSFTYTPAADDIGNDVTITLTTNNPLGEPCSPATTFYVLTVAAVPSTPTIGTVTHPTCISSTGSVVISGLPGSGTWTLRRTPGNISIQGNGSSTTVSGLPAGSYTFVVESGGCSSGSSASVTINPQPEIPSAPVASSVVQPTCTVSTGAINLGGLPESGTWTLTRYPGTVVSTGTGTTATITQLSSGTYNFTVRNSAGCTSALSANIVINAQPPTPAAPAPGEITAPTCPQPLGRVNLSGLPAGRWTITSTPGDLTVSGTGASATFGGLSPGTYTFTVTNSAGCISPASTNVVIPAIPDAPVVNITDPAPVCSPLTVDLTVPGVTGGSTPGLTLSYWTDASGTVQYNSPGTANDGVYYIRGTNAAQCSDIKPVRVTVLNPPVADAGQDMELNYIFSASLEARQIEPGETGQWLVFSGRGGFADPSSPVTNVINLDLGENVFVWSVTNNVCPSVSDTLKILVNDLVVPTLITPNEDGRNDYFILSGIEQMDNSELRIFDRRGVLVFRDDNYKNTWNGVDYNAKPLSDDTYFFVLRTSEGRQRTGFIVIRR